METAYFISLKIVHNFTHIEFKHGEKYKNDIALNIVSKVDCYSQCKLLLATALSPSSDGSSESNSFQNFGAGLGSTSKNLLLLCGVAVSIECTLWKI